MIYEITHDAIWHNNGWHVTSGAIGKPIDVSDAAITMPVMPATIQGAAFRRCKFDHQDLERCELNNCIFEDCSFSLCNLNFLRTNQTTFSGVKFLNCTLKHARLYESSLSDSTLEECDLTGIDLRYVELNNMDMDFSSWPLWCGSTWVKTDQRVAAQLALHLWALTCDDPTYQEVRPAIEKLARLSHRFTEVSSKKVNHEQH